MIQRVMGVRAITWCHGDEGGRKIAGSKGGACPRLTRSALTDRIRVCCVQNPKETNKPNPDLARLGQAARWSAARLFKLFELNQQI